MTPLPPLHASTPAEGDNAGKVWTLTAPYRVRIASNFNGQHIGIIVVPNGFSTDFASVPRMLWRVLPPFGEYMLAAVVHDYLYSRGKYKRKTADLVFRFLMQRLHVDSWKLRTMYWAVRALGWVAWKKHRKGEKPHGEG
jgi:hypothetical protein